MMPRQLSLPAHRPHLYNNLRHRERHAISFIKDL